MNLKYFWWLYREYIKTPKNCGFCEELSSENDFKTVSGCRCDDYGSKASEAVHRITTDRKDYRKCSSCVIVCWLAKIYQSITAKKGWFLPDLQLKMLQKLHRKRNNNWPMMSFIHNGSEITTWMVYSWKTKNTKFKATFLR